MAIKRAGTSRRLPRRSRTYPLHGNNVRGDGEDSGKWFRCWNCGFICNKDRDSIGDINSRSADGQIEYYTPSYGSVDMSGECNAIMVLNGNEVALEQGADGNPKGIRHNLRSDVYSGCPFCGSLNWRGDY